MKLDKKKVNSLLLTYVIPTAPLASAAFAMDATPLIKFLSFLSGALVVIGRQVNPKDSFTCNLMHEAQIEVDKLLKAELKKEKK